MSSPACISICKIRDKGSLLSAIYLLVIFGVMRWGLILNFHLATLTIGLFVLTYNLCTPHKIHRPLGLCHESNTFILFMANIMITVEYDSLFISTCRGMTDKPINLSTPTPIPNPSLLKQKSPCPSFTERMLRCAIYRCKHQEQHQSLTQKP